MMEIKPINCPNCEEKIERVEWYRDGSLEEIAENCDDCYYTYHWNNGITIVDFPGEEVASVRKNKV